MSMKKILLAVGLIASLRAGAEVAVPMVQLPYQNPQQLRNMIDQDDRFFSLQKTLRVFDKYVPPDYGLIVHGRSWPSYRGACRDVYRNAQSCKAAMHFLVQLMEQKEELGLTKMRTIAIEDIPYRDPAPLEAALQGLDWTNGAPSMTHEEAKELLAPYLEMSVVVDAPSGSQFNYSRTMCIYDEFVVAPWSAPYYVHCRAYASALLEIMRQYEAAAARMIINPFSR